jgi:hypothetical protein
MSRHYLVEIKRIEELEPRASPNSTPLASRGGAIGIGYMQIPIRVDYGIDLGTVARRGSADLPNRCESHHRRYSSYGDSCDVDSLHGAVTGKAFLLQATLSYRIHLSNSG